MSGADNARRWDGQSPGHYEVWYLTFNHRDSGTGFWIRYTLESPIEGKGAAFAQIWFAYFDSSDPERNFAINHIEPIDAMRCESNPFSVDIGNARLDDGSATGAMRGGGHTAKWNLSWPPADNTHHHTTGVWSAIGRFASTQVVTPNLDVPISGSVEIDGTRVQLVDEPGGQTHLWGKKHAREWAWGHCTAFDAYRGVALETISARLERAGRQLPWLSTMCLYLGGETYRFSGFGPIVELSTGFYRFVATAGRTRLEGEFSCRPTDMVTARYTDPDGEPAYCANTEVGDLRVTLFTRSSRLSRMRERARLVARGTGHFEIGTRNRDAAIGKDHVTI